MHNPSNLRVRARAFDFVVALYKAYQRQPPRTVRGAPGLCPQLLRAATSISSNIVEGAGHESAARVAHYVTIAIASANEAELQLQLAVELDLFKVEGPRFIAEVQEIRKMLFGWRKRVRLDAGSPSPDH